MMRVSACGTILLSLLVGCDSNKERKDAGSRYPLVPIEEPLKMYFETDVIPVPIKAREVLVLPLFQSGAVDGKRFKYATTRPFIFHPGERLVVPGRLPGDLGACLMIAPGYWPMCPNRTFFYTKIVNGVESIIAPMAPARSKAEATRILTAFRWLLEKDEFVVSDPLDLANIPDRWDDEIVMRVATATEHESYLRHFDGHGLNFRIWPLNQRTRIKVLLTDEDRVLLKRFFDAALRPDTQPDQSLPRAQSGPGQ